MCGRFAQSKMEDALVEEYGITGAHPTSPLPASWNIAPTKNIYIVREDQQRRARELATASWGLIGSWHKDLATARASQSHAINARRESVFEKPTFRDAIRRRRCLVPADGYYEWATALGPYRPKQPFYISSPDGKSLSFAGIWNEWVSPNGQLFESVAIITCDSFGKLATIHSRMPTILPKDRWESWIDPMLTHADELRKLMEYSDLYDGLSVDAVSNSVNSAAHDGPELIKPITLGEPQTLF
jgi:putative SOS response-associated peptidase YedK